MTTKDLSKILYVFLLNDNKYFVYHTSTEEQEAAKFECQLLHSFVRKYHPIQIMEQKYHQEISDIDKYVKKYMHLFGIENVRGGSYLNEILEDYQIKTLENELEFLNNHEKENNEMYHFLYHDVKNYDDVSNLEHLATLKDKYIQTKRELETFQIDNPNIFFTENQQSTIHISHLEYIQWIKQWIQSSHQNNRKIHGKKREEEIKQKYRKIMIYLQHLFKLNYEYRFQKEEQNGEQELNKKYPSIPFLYFKNPKVLFDEYFYSTGYTLLKKTNYTIALKVCDIFEDFFYWGLTRTQELEFEVHHTIPYIEKKTDLVHYIHHLRNVHR